MLEMPQFPMTAYHPVHGAVTVNTPEEAASMFQPEHDWFKTPEEADAHRTDREAQMVIHNGRRAQLDRYQESDPVGVVKHSVTHQETVDRTVEANEAAAEALGAPVPESKDETRGAELQS